MKVLFLTPIFPVSVNSGIQQRMSLTLRTLCSMAEVTLISFGEDCSRNDLQNGILESCREVQIVPSQSQLWRRPTRGRWRSRIGRLKGHILDPRPWCARCLDSPVLQQELSAVGVETFDLVWVQSLGLYGQILASYDLPRVVVDLPDAESVKAARELRSHPWAAHLALEVLDWLKLRLAERTWGADRHWFVVCSERDRQHLGKHRGKVCVVRNAVELPGDEVLPAERGDSLLFVGTLAYKPNRDAVRYFVREVLPLILRARPSARLYVVGSNPPPEISALARDPHVVVTGYVEDVEPYLRQASVAVVPLLNGAGTRIKILEAMSFKRAVVSTPIGAEGLAVKHGVNILLADTAEEFALCCLRLLRDPEGRARLGETGREFVRAHHMAQHARQDLMNFLNVVFENR